MKNKSYILISLLLFTALAVSFGKVAADKIGMQRDNPTQPHQSQNEISPLINSPGFSLAQNFPAGSNPQSITSAKIGTDNKPEIIVCNPNNDSISILNNKGTGVFGSPQSISVGTQPVVVLSGDFNGDGKADIVTANAGSNDLSVLLNNGSSLSTAVSVPLTAAPNALAIADINGDGKLDIVATSFNGTSYSVLLGNGDGTFNLHTVGTNNNPIGVALADVNKDGSIDLIITNSPAPAIAPLVSSSPIDVFLGNGDGTFNQTTTSFFASGSFNPGVIVGDFNQDTNPDIAVSNNDLDSISILFGDGTGQFSQPTDVTVDSGPSGLSAKDLNGDGKLDIVVANNNAHTLSVVLNNSSTTGFQTSVFSLSTGSLPDTVVIDDFDQDGKLDIANNNISSNNVSVFLNNTPLSCSNTSLIFSPTVLATQTVNVFFSTRIIVNGGVSPYTISQVGGTLPSGVTISTASPNSVNLSGTPTDSGSFSFTLSTKDANGCTAIQTYNLMVDFCGAIIPISGDNQQANPNTNFAQPLVVQVLNSNQQPLAGAQITFAISFSSSGGSTFNTSTPSTSVTVTTNASGLATSPTIKAGAFNQSFSVSASMPNTECQGAFFNLNVTNCINAQAVGGSGQATFINQVFGQSLRVKVTDANNQPIPQVFFYFQANTSTNGSTGTFTVNGEGGPEQSSQAFAITDNNGIATAPVLTANNVPGVFTVTTFIEGACAPATFNLIINGSIPSAGTIQFSNNNYTVTEGSPATILVQRSGPKDGRVAVNYSTSNGSGVAGKDYTSTSGTIVFNDGDNTAKSFTIPTIANSLFEPNKTVSLFLVLTSGNATLGLSRATLTIMDKDSGPKPGSLSFGNANYSVNETAGSAAITIVRTSDSNVPVNVSFSTKSGSALPGVNYGDISSVLTFAAGETTKLLNVPIFNDNKFTGDNTVTLVLSGATGGATIATATALLTIIEASPAPVPAKLQVASSVDFGRIELGSSGRQTVNISNVGGQKLTLAPPSLSGTGFSLVSQPNQTLAPNESTSLDISYQALPGSLGTAIGSLVLTSNGGAASINLTANSVDTTPPQVTILNPGGGQILTAGSAVTINFTGKDNDSINDYVVSYLASGNQANSGSGDIARADGTSQSVTWQIPANLETAQGQIIVVAKDRAGNIAKATSGQFSIRRQASTAPLLNVNIDFMPPNPGDIAPPTGVGADAKERRDGTLSQSGAPVLQVVITFDPPPAGQLAPPQNFKLRASELIFNPIAPPTAIKDSHIYPAADGLVLKGYNIYRVPQPTDGTIPPPEKVVQPQNLVVTLPPDAVGFTDKVSTAGSDNYVYSATSFFNDNSMSGGAPPMGTSLPVIKNVVFRKGTIFFDAAGSFVKPGAQLIVNDNDSYPIQFDATGTLLTIPKKMVSQGSGQLIKRLIKKGTSVKLVAKNPDNSLSVAVKFSRTKGARVIGSQTFGYHNPIKPLVDAPVLLGYNIYRVAEPASGPTPQPEDIVKPENLVGSIPANMTSYVDVVSTTMGSNFTYSVTSFFNDKSMSKGSKPASTDIPVLKNPMFQDSSLFIDAAGSFIKDGAKLIVNDQEMFALAFDGGGTRFKVGKNITSMPGNKAITDLLVKGTQVRLTIMNPDGKLSVGVNFTR